MTPLPPHPNLCEGESAVQNSIRQSEQDSSQRTCFLHSTRNQTLGKRLIVYSLWNLIFKSQKRSILIATKFSSVLVGFSEREVADECDVVRREHDARDGDELRQLLARRHRNDLRRRQRVAVDEHVVQRLLEPGRKVGVLRGAAAARQPQRVLQMRCWNHPLIVLWKRRRETA